MTESTNHWTIIGAGAIGHLFACRFQLMNIPATLIAPRQPLQQHYKVDYHFDNNVQQCSLTIQSNEDCPSIDNLLLAVKAQQVEAAINGIKTALKESTQVFLLQNGMGTLETVNKLLAGIVAPTQIYPGSNSHGVYLSINAKERRQVIHAGYGNVVIGRNYLATKEKNQPECLNQLKQLSLGVSWVPDIERRLWLKIAINAAINPLTATHQCLNGELLDSEALIKQVELLCSETADLYKTLDLNIDKDELIHEVFNVIVKTAGNQSSMLQDTIAGKETEIEAITGYLLSKASSCNVKMETHQTLYQAIINLKHTL